jgi:hypothetical protein
MSVYRTGELTLWYVAQRLEQRTHNAYEAMQHEIAPMGNMVQITCVYAVSFRLTSCNAVHLA